jgi:hypothetical protein
MDGDCAESIGDVSLPKESPRTQGHKESDECVNAFVLYVEFIQVNAIIH